MGQKIFLGTEAHVKIGFRTVMKNRLEAGNQEQAEFMGQKKPRLSCYVVFHNESNYHAMNSIPVPPAEKNPLTRCFYGTKRTSRGCYRLWAWELVKEHGIWGFVGILAAYVLINSRIRLTVIFGGRQRKEK